jgi:hypothetical protein
MAAISGSALFVLWTTSNGTTTLTGEQTTLTYTPSIEMYDETAGADAALQYIPGRYGGALSMSVNGQAADGSALAAQLWEGKLGTLTWGEQGSVSAKPKHLAAFYCTGMKTTYPYNNVITYTADFQQNGSRTDGTF